MGGGRATDMRGRPLRVPPAPADGRWTGGLHCWTVRHATTFNARPAHAVAGAVAATVALAAAADGVARTAASPGAPVAGLLRITVAVIAVVLVVFHLAALLRGRRRPVLTVTDAWIEYAPPEAVRPQRLRSDQVEGMAYAGRDDLGVRLHSGEVVDLSLMTLPRARRPEASAAVRAFVARHAEGEPGRPDDPPSPSRHRRES